MKSLDNKVSLEKIILTPLWVEIMFNPVSSARALHLNSPSLRGNFFFTSIKLFGKFIVRDTWGVPNVG